MKNHVFVSLILLLMLVLPSNKLFSQWYEMPQMQFHNIYCTLAVNDSLVFVGGDNGIFLRSTDAGLTWENKIGNGFWVDTVLSLGHGLGYIFAGANGAGSIFRSFDEGENWKPANKGLPSAAQIKAFAFLGSILFTATDQGVYSSADSGKSWKADTAGLSMNQLYPGIDRGICGIASNGSKLFTIKATGGTVYTSSSDTVLWKQISPDYQGTGLALTSIDTNIFIATSGGMFLYGGGAYWINRSSGLPVNDSNIMYSCIFTSTDSVLFANVITNSNPGCIYYTTNLGLNWKPIKDSSFSAASVFSIAANKDYLFAGTRGGGWRLEVAKIITDVKSAANGFPLGYELSQNYPNPFNPGTTIGFTIPEREVVTLKVYDILGRLVTTLVNEEKSAGTYKVEFNSNNRPPATNRQLSSGIYFYQLKAGILMQTKKMMLLK